MNAYQLNETTTTPQGYARTLYENYRARMVAVGHFVPTWDNASPSAKREFIREARQLLV